MPTPDIICSIMRPIKSIAPWASFIDGSLAGCAVPKDISAKAPSNSDLQTKSVPLTVAVRASGASAG